MQYRDHEVRFDWDSDELEAEALLQQNNGKRHRMKRCAKPTRRRHVKSSHPSYGIAGRRHHRWDPFPVP